MEKVKIGIIGSTGYTGMELVRILEKHPRAEILFLGANTHHGKNISTFLPNLKFKKNLKIRKNSDIYQIKNKGNRYFNMKKVLEEVKKTQETEKIDYVIAQGENSAGGFGITKKTSIDFFQSGVDVITSGNHIWDKSDIFEELDVANSKILRPNNYPNNKPGTGIFFNNKLAVINLIGSVWMGDINSPFDSIASIVDELPNVPIFIDFHAEATSEKAAMAWHLDCLLYTSPSPRDS